MAVEKIALSRLPQVVDQPIDVLICCGSFERRCLSVPSAIEPESVRKVIVGEHVNLHRHVAANTTKLMERFGSKAQALGLNSASPIESADNIADALESCHFGSKRRVLVDVTTFTHESLLILAELLGTVFSNEDDVHFVYTIAEKYAPDLPDGDKWLSKGIKEIRSVLGFPGRVLPGRGVHLVLLHGLEAERSKSLIATYEPEFLSLGRSDEFSTLAGKELLSANKRVHEEVLGFAHHTVDVEEFPFLANDPEESCRVLQEQAGRRSDLSVIIAPMNTKLSALGAGLAARGNRDIQLCYAQPLTYNYEHYSEPSNECYAFRMPGFLETRLALEVDG